MDAAEWAKQAERPVMGPGVNRWLLVRRSDDDVSTDEVETSAREALAFWLGFAGPSMMRGIKVLSVQVSPKPLSLAHPLALRREELPELPIVAGGKPPWYVVLEFSSTLPRTSLPWPVITHDALGWDYRPSASADWMMMGAEAPREAKPDETPKGPLERLEKSAGELGDTLKNVAIGVAALVVVAAIVQAVRR